MIRRQPRVCLVAWITVAGHEDANSVLRHRQLTERGNDRGIDPAAETDDKSLSAGCYDPVAKPAGEVFRRRAHRVNTS
jgi:hypothetical protein